jgi:hypothetical protein
VTGEEEPVPVFPLEEVTVYVDTAFPPVAPAVNATEALALPLYACPVATEAVPTVGACGTVVAVIEEDEEDTLVAAALAAETVNV